jgi:hypothetical protein
MSAKHIAQQQGDDVGKTDERLRVPTTMHWRADWMDLIPYWDVIVAKAEEREQQKRRFQSSKLWRGSGSTHLPGLAGEVVYALATGQKADIRLRVTGDNGIDFPDGVDVKTSTYWRDPWLKVPQTTRRWPSYFALVALDLDDKRGRVMGLITPEALQRHGELLVWNAAAGPQWSLSGDVLALAQRVG